jgi:hypothetical protein
MSTNRNGLNGWGKISGWRGRRDRREGYRQRAIRRQFIALHGATVTTRDLLLAAYPRLVVGEHVPDWQWTKVRRAAERWAVRVGRRSRPLKWRARPEALE